MFYFRVEEKFAGGKFREIPFGVDIISAGGKFRAKSKFANIAKISSTRKIGVIYSIYSLIQKHHSAWHLVQCSTYQHQDTQTRIHQTRIHHTALRSRPVNVWRRTTGTTEKVRLTCGSRLHFDTECLHRRARLLPQTFWHV